MTGKVRAPGRALALACALAACSSPTDDGMGSAVQGNWRYTATQAAPPASLAGTLFITDQSGAVVSGRLEVLETDAVGVPHPRAGAVTGRAAQSALVDFDALFGPAPRRHVGRLTADTISGTWVESAGGATLTGSFRAVRDR